MTRNRLRFAVAAALASSAGATTQVGLAQQETATTLEEIVVTATRREQDLQEVPVSIVAITGDNLTLRGIDDLEELGSQVPNINIQGSGSGTNDAQFRIRGIPNVGLYVDGVWQVSDIGFLNQEFVDLDRVEVLRGPQGTTYGRDSVGGAIRIWTARPEEEFGGRISATTGSLNRRDVRAVVDVPITENLLTKWTASTFYRDGYIQSLNIEQKNGGIDQTVFRGDLLWTPTDRLSMRFTYSERDQQFTEPRIQDGIFDTSANMGQSVLLTHFYELAGELSGRVSGRSRRAVGELHRRDVAIEDQERADDLGC
jgi:iron complex outermembrane receptor protein